MRQEIETITYYTFADLLNLHKQEPQRWYGACDKARAWLLSDYLYHDDWHDYIYEKWSDALDEIGFTNTKIRHSGFWSQGDGASFLCSDVDVDLLVDFVNDTDLSPNNCIAYDGQKELFKPWLLHQTGFTPSTEKFHRIKTLANHFDLSFEVVNISSRYVHENTAQFEINGNCYLDGGKRIELKVEAFIACVERLREQICQAIYSNLSDEYEYLQSDEYLSENDQSAEFTEDGDFHDWNYNFTEHQMIVVQTPQQGLDKLHDKLRRRRRRVSKIKTNG